MLDRLLDAENQCESCLMNAKQVTPSLTLYASQTLRLPIFRLEIHRLEEVSSIAKAYSTLILLMNEGDDWCLDCFLARSLGEAAKRVSSLAEGATRPILKQFYPH